MVKKKVLITGLTGKRQNSIGSSFLEEYHKKYSKLYDLTVGINKTPLEGYKTVKINLSNVDELIEIFSGFDVVVNLAANSDPASDFNSLVEPNLIGTYNILEAARRANVKRVILASSVHAIRGYPLGKSVRMNEMAKPLLSFPKNERYKVASQRINSKSMGLSYRAALDYMEKTKSMPKEEVK